VAAKKITRTILSYVAINQGKDQAAWYLERFGEEAADRVRGVISAGIRNIAARPESGKLINGLPRTYRRVRSAPYYLYYELDYNAKEAFIFLLRHESQRPYAPSTIRNKLREARHGGSVPLPNGNEQAKGEQEDDEELACSLQPQQLRLRRRKLRFGKHPLRPQLAEPL
jgi:plasmid stabilization system protein ParE